MKNRKIADFLQIKPFRERKRLTRNELANTLGAAQTTYYNWENGNREPPFSVIKKLFEMGATVEELFGVKIETEESFPPKGEFEKRVCEVLAKHLTGLMKQIKQDV